MKKLFLLRSMLLALALISPPCTAVYAARLNDVDAVPHLGSEGKEGYRKFLASGKHRAFAIAPGGTWSWKGDGASVESASAEALLYCRENTDQQCVLYAVDDKLVFDAARWSGLWGPYLKNAEAGAAPTGTDRGKRFYNLSFRSPAGKPMNLADLRGKVVLLHFWGSWCPSCRSEMQELARLHQMLGSARDISLVLLQVREDFATAQQWLRQQKLSLPLHDSGVKSSKVDTLDVAGGKTLRDRDIAFAFPNTYILDKNGIVVFSHIGAVSGWPQYLPMLRDVAEKSGRQ